MAMRRLKAAVYRWQLKNGLVLIQFLQAGGRKKMMLANQLDVPMYGLPYSGADEAILLAKNGAELDKRIREELERRRQKAKFILRLLWPGISFLLPTPAL